ncbi:thioredoxin-like protein [Ramicandelaber brevisporus]|nr:thioredoxin-like protein [Ramicandelaber brevisporus]
MPKKELTIYLDIISGFTYVLLERLSVFFEHLPSWRPSADFSIKIELVDLRALFARCKNPIPLGIANKGPYLMKEIRWTFKSLDVPFEGAPRDPETNQILPLDLALALVQLLSTSDDVGFHVVFNVVRAMQRSFMGAKKSLVTKEDITAALAPVELDTALLGEWLDKAEENKDSLLKDVAENTDKFFASGGFGCPTMVPKVEGETDEENAINSNSNNNNDDDMFFFGSDRLEHVAHVLDLEYLPVGKHKSSPFKPLKL